MARSLVDSMYAHDTLESQEYAKIYVVFVMNGYIVNVRVDEH